jgi:hypothetical protein
MKNKRSNGVDHVDVLLLLSSCHDICVNLHHVFLIYLYDRKIPLMYWIKRMLNSICMKANQKIMHMSKLLLLTGALTVTAQVAMAGPAVDQLSDCLMKSTTATDKTTVLQWTFVALSTHPDLQSFSHVTAEQKQQLDKNLAQVLQRIIVEQCSAQTKAVIQAEGLEAIGDSFQQLGRTTGEEILKNPEVNQQLKGLVRYIDISKVATTFLTPDLLNNLKLFK